LGYFKALKIYQRCPEIRHLMNKRIGVGLYDLLRILPWVIVLIIPALIIWLGEWLERKLRWVGPGFSWEHRQRIILYEIHEILKPWEIRERIKK